MLDPGVMRREVQPGSVNTERKCCGLGRVGLHTLLLAAWAFPTSLWISSRLGLVARVAFSRVGVVFLSVCFSLFLAGAIKGD